MNVLIKFTLEPLLIPSFVLTKPTIGSNGVELSVKLLNREALEALSEEFRRGLFQRAAQTI